MDDREANYLRGRVRELERSRAWWRTGAVWARQQSEEAARQAASANLKQIAIRADYADAPADWPAPMEVMEGWA